MSVKITGGEKVKIFMDKVKKQKSDVDAGFFKESIYPDGQQVAQIAIWNEFGTISQNGNVAIPPRPFMSQTVKDNKKKWMAMLEKIISSQGENINLEQALNKIGAVMAGDIKKTISNGNNLFVPNSPITIAKKGKDTVLRDTNVMLNSVNYVVNKK
jgi:hypothetical protein